jgi:hypothetical protein
VQADVVAAGATGGGGVAEGEVVAAYALLLEAAGDGGAAGGEVLGAVVELHPGDAGAVGGVGEPPRHQAYGAARDPVTALGGVHGVRSRISSRSTNDSGSGEKDGSPNRISSGSR